MSIHLVLEQCLPGHSKINILEIWFELEFRTSAAKWSCQTARFEFLFFFMFMTRLPCHHI